MKKKKNFLPAMFLVVALAVFAAGCGSSEPAADEGNTDAETVMPLYPLESAEDALADGGYSVGFTAGNLVQGENGYELTAEVFDYDKYDTADVEKLEKGSKIQICNEEVTIDTIETEEDGSYVTINGGIENGGYELKKEDGIYRTITMDDYPVYYSVGTVTIPVAEDVTFEDHSDWDKEPDGETGGMESLIAALDRDDAAFSCANTVITVRDERVVQVIRYWIP